MLPKRKLLEINNLQIVFQTNSGVKNVVKDLNISLRKGDTLGIVGESGSGKTLTALSIMQLLPQSAKISSGNIIFHKEETNSIDLITLPEKEKQQYRGKDIAMIFQDPMSSLNPVFKCGHQITEAIRANERVSRIAARQRCMQLLKKVQLEDTERFFNAYPHQLSGGQKQRIMIAMALATNPKILIADEPTTALDVEVQQSILLLINDLKEAFQLSVIFISHDLGVVGTIANRVVVMKDGNIVEDGFTEDIFQNPQHIYTKGLLAAQPPIDRKLKKLPVLEDFLEGKIPEPEIIDETAILSKIKTLQQQPPVLTVEHLTVWFDGRKNFFGKPVQFIKAIDDMSLEVFPSEILGIVGASGSGKSTLAKAILRFIPIKAGVIKYKGEEVQNFSEKELRAFRKDIQIIFQDPLASLNPLQTIGDAIFEPIKYHGLGKNNDERYRKVLELMRTVQLPEDYYNRYPHQLSGGEQQRACIARAIAVDPSLLICDECVSSLDLTIQAKVLNLLKDLRDRLNLTIIFISHDPAVVKFISDRVLEMK